MATEGVTDDDVMEEVRRQAEWLSPAEIKAFYLQAEEAVISYIAEVEELKDLEDTMHEVISRHPAALADFLECLEAEE